MYNMKVQKRVIQKKKIRKLWGYTAAIYFSSLDLKGEIGI